jgi:hypothetical protein
MGWLNVIEAHKNLGLELPVSYHIRLTYRADIVGQHEDDFRGYGRERVS